jgi:hypothetical protein
MTFITTQQCKPQSWRWTNRSAIAVAGQEASSENRQSSAVIGPAVKTQSNFTTPANELASRNETTPQVSHTFCLKHGSRVKTTKVPFKCYSLTSCNLVILQAGSHRKRALAERIERYCWGMLTKPACGKHTKRLDASPGARSIRTRHRAIFQQLVKPHSMKASSQAAAALLRQSTT